LNLERNCKLSKLNAKICVQIKDFVIEENACVFMAKEVMTVAKEFLYQH